MTNKIDGLDMGWEVLWGTIKIALHYAKPIILVIAIVLIAYLIFKYVFNKLRILFGKRPEK